MKRRRWGVLIGVILLPVLLLISSQGNGKTPPIQNFERPRLIETNELAGIVNHPSVRIVDLRSSLPDYLKGHIPNAVYLHFESLRVPDGGIPGQLPGRISLEQLLGDSLSVSNDMWVILYTERSNSNATYLAWTLEFLGHKRVGILNGGWEKWAADKLETTQEYPKLAPKKFFAKVRRDILAEKKWVRDHLASKDVVIVDGRPPKQYSGEEGEEIRKGHIPGARNVFWETTLDGSEVRVWKKKEDLDKLFAEAGIEKKKEIIVHCRTGREASHVYFTLKHLLDFPRVRLYRGSWVEWSADMLLPIKAGMEP